MVNVTKEDAEKIVKTMAQNIYTEFLRLYPDADAERATRAAQASAADVFALQPIMTALGDADKRAQYPAWSVTVKEPRLIIDTDNTEPKTILAFVGHHNIEQLDPHQQNECVNWLVTSCLLREPLARAALYYHGYKLSFGLGAKCP